MLYLNMPAVPTAEMPFGGVKDSGYGSGRRPGSDGGLPQHPLRQHDERIAHGRGPLAATHLRYSTTRSRSQALTISAVGAGPASASQPSTAARMPAPAGATPATCRGCGVGSVVLLRPSASSSNSFSPGRKPAKAIGTSLGFCRTAESSCAPTRRCAPARPCQARRSDRWCPSTRPAAPVARPREWS